MPCGWAASFHWTRLWQRFAELNELTVAMLRAEPPAALFALFPFAFIGMWLFVGALLGEFSGWTSLARRFPGGARPKGTRLRRVVVQMGAVSENGVTVLIPTTDGLYLYSHPLFRFRRPPILLPWSEIRYAGERGRLWWCRTMLEVSGSTPLGVKPKGYAVLAPYMVQRPDRPPA